EVCAVADTDGAHPVLGGELDREPHAPRRGHRPQPSPRVDERYTVVTADGRRARVHVDDARLDPLVVDGKLLHALALTGQRSERSREENVDEDLGVAVGHAHLRGSLAAEPTEYVERDGDCRDRDHAASHASDRPGASPRRASGLNILKICYPV